VLVIIGLLLGGILKGQEMITQAKIKNLINDFNGVTVAVVSYQDRYRALPGDDKTASTRWTTQAANRWQRQRNRRRRLQRDRHPHVGIAACLQVPAQAPLSPGRGVAVSL